MVSPGQVLATGSDVVNVVQWSRQPVRSAQDRTQMLVMAGWSASGKNTYYKLLREKYPYIERVQSYTTRPFRDEAEQALGQYHRVSREHFEALRKAGTLITDVTVNNEFYGFAEEYVNQVRSRGKVPLFDAKVETVQALAEKYGKENIKAIFLRTPNIAILEEFMRNRKDGMSEEQIAERLKMAPEELLNAEKANLPIIINEPGKMSEILVQIERVFGLINN